jgi:hypothetical protein
MFLVQIKAAYQASLLALAFVGKWSRQGVIKKETGWEGWY